MGRERRDGEVIALTVIRFSLQIIKKSNVPRKPLEDFCLFFLCVPLKFQFQQSGIQTPSNQNVERIFVLIASCIGNKTVMRRNSIATMIIQLFEIINNFNYKQNKKKCFKHIARKLICCMTAFCKVNLCLISVSSQ